MKWEYKDVFIRWEQIIEREGLYSEVVRHLGENEWEIYQIIKSKRQKEFPSDWHIFCKRPLQTKIMKRRKV